jgi:hypothetical protein
MRTRTHSFVVAFETPRLLPVTNYFPKRTSKIHTLLFNSVVDWLVLFRPLILTSAVFLNQCSPRLSTQKIACQCSRSNLVALFRVENPSTPLLTSPFPLLLSTKATFAPHPQQVKQHNIRGGSQLFKSQKFNARFPTTGNINSRVCFRAPIQPI